MERWQKRKFGYFKNKFNLGNMKEAEKDEFIEFMFQHTLKPSYREKLKAVA